MADVVDFSAALRAQRKVLWVKGGDIDQVVDQAEENLIAVDHEVFQYSNELVAIRPKSFDSADGKQETGLRTIALTPFNLIERLTAANNFVKPLVRGDGTRQIDCPEKVARVYLDRRRWRVPILKGLSTAPILYPDGHIVTRPGYDPESGMYFDPQGMEFPEVPEEPSEDDARRALDGYLDLLKDFPVVGPVDQAAMVSQTLTLLARRCFPHAPLYACSASAAGSGKTLCQDISAIIATGAAASACRFSPDTNELDKLLGTILAEAPPVILFDNVPEGIILQGDRLCQALTKDEVDFRALGFMRRITASTSTVTFFANGNNLAVGGDASRRALIWNLDPKCEAPELRGLDEERTRLVVKNNRGRLVAAGLTILRYYIQAGFPDPVAPIGNFESWSRFVPSALRHLGMADATQAMRSTRQEDPKRAKLWALLREWRNHFGVAYATATKAANDAALRTFDGNPAHPALREALLSVAAAKEKNNFTGNISVDRLGSYLRSHKGNVVNGHRLIRSSDRTNTSIWAVTDDLTQPTDLSE